MSSLTLAETVFYNEDSASPLTVTKLGSFAVDNLLVIVISDTDGVLADISSATWTDEGSPVDITGQRCKVFSHVVAGGDPATWDFNYNSGSAMAAVLFRYTLADTTPVVVVESASTLSNGSTMDSPTATPSGMDDVDVAVHTNSCANNVLSYIQPSGLTDLGKTQASGTFQGVAAAWTTLTSSSPTGAQTWTSISPTAKQCGTFTILVKSSGVYDPDPPRHPTPTILPPWLRNQLLVSKSRELVGHQFTPVIKDTLFGQASGVNITLTTQATVDDTDLLVAFHGNNFYTAAQLLAPTGTAGTWTERALGDNGTNSVHQKIWTRPVTAGGVQTVTFAPASDEEHTATLFVVSGADLTNPSDGAAGNNGAASTSHVAPSVSPATLNALLLCGSTSGTNVDYTAPPTMFERSENDVPSFMTGTTASAELGTSGATGTRTFTCNISSVFATATIAIKAAGEAAGGTEHTVNQTDDTFLTDSTTQEVIKLVEPTDQVGLTDSVLLTFDWVREDQTGLTDTATVASTHDRTITDNAGLTDSSTQELVKSVNATDNVGLTDSVEKTVSDVFTDQVGLTDTATAASTHDRTSTDSIGLTDSTTQEVIKLVAQTDQTGLTDSPSLVATYSRTQTDQAGLTDSVTVALTHDRTFTDQAGLTDSVTAGLVRLVTQTDDTGLTDLVSLFVTHLREITDAIGLTDLAVPSGIIIAPGTTDPLLTSTAQSRHVTTTDVDGLTTSTGR